MYNTYSLPRVTNWPHRPGWSWRSWKTLVWKRQKKELAAKGKICYLCAFVQSTGTELEPSVYFCTEKLPLECFDIHACHMEVIEAREHFACSWSIWMQREVCMRVCTRKGTRVRLHAPKCDLQLGLQNQVDLQ